MNDRPVQVKLYLTGGQVVETHDHELSEDDETAMLQIKDKLDQGRWQELGGVWFHTQSISAIAVDTYTKEGTE